MTKVIVVVSHSHGPRYLVMLGSSATGLPHVAPPPRRVSSHGRHEIWACNPPDRGRRRRRHSDVAVVQLPGHEDVPADVAPLSNDREMQAGKKPSVPPTPTRRSAARDERGRCAARESMRSRASAKELWGRRASRLFDGEHNEPKSTTRRCCLHRLGQSA